MCQIQYSSDSLTFKLSKSLSFIYIRIIDHETIVKSRVSNSQLSLHYDKCYLILVSFVSSCPRYIVGTILVELLLYGDCFSLFFLLFSFLFSDRSYYFSHLSFEIGKILTEKTSILTRFRIFCKTVGKTVVLTGSIAAIRSNGKRDEGL